MSRIAIVRVSGSPDLRDDVKDTMRILNLTRPNHCVIRKEDSSLRGMLEKSKEALTWGPIEGDVLKELLENRGEFEGGKSVTDEEVDSRTPYGSVEKLTDAVYEGEYDLRDVEGLKKVFRLSPPSKGYNPTRRSYLHGGAVGDRGEDINDLLLRMI